MFDDLLLHPHTRLQLEQFVANPSHGLILTGPEGSGKRFIARAVAAALLHVKPGKLTQYPYYSLTDPSENSITIDEIRALQKLLTLRTPQGNNGGISRILTIINATRMRFEAQNAFLKSLEEPPADTCIILTAEANGDLLETIFSRLQRIEILPVSEAMAKVFYSKLGTPATELARNYALSQGQVGLLNSLLSKEADHPLKAWVETGKAIYAKSPNERLLQTDELSKDKPGVLLLLNALGRIAHAALVGASKAGNTKAAQRWQNSLKAVQAAQIALGSNANLKLVLDNLLLNL